MLLDYETFRSIVTCTPLIAIDLVIQNRSGDVLLGRRTNRPAKGAWFVPGGRILKSETMDSAFKRLTFEELGRSVERIEANLLGVYEHFYADSVFAPPGEGPDTHYIVLAYKLVMEDSERLHPPRAQHDSYRWWSLIEMQTSKQVHANTRAYLSALR
ncbi:GDP-mannose mannosyl hydrolase [Pseudomonas helleri]|uniref:GDP-mannose mannosyl hydrolase n=1 Tax=Pseudomonas helleri TaxID=1608996 RepID=UPI003FD620D7